MTGRWFSAGSVVAALATAVCCLGPILFTALGLSTFASLWMLRHLVPYRTLFFAVTFLFLSLGFYVTYRRGGHSRKLDRVILWGAIMLVTALVGYSVYIDGPVLF